MIDHIFHYKFLFGVLSGFLVMIGSTIEPSVGIWVISLGGSLLTVALGKDQGLGQICLHMVIGLFFGIFGSQVIHLGLAANVRRLVGNVHGLLQ